MLRCQLSGNPVKEPVLSKTGYVFERSTIEQYVEAKGACPVSEEPLTLDDLVPIKGLEQGAAPRPVSATSIPSLLQTFQNEWDAVMLETFTLKKQLDQTRLELAHALYRQDASKRAIARLIRERDEAREALEQLEAQVGSNGAAAGGSGMQQDDDEAAVGLPEEVTQHMDEVSTQLSGQRRSREVSTTLASKAAVKALKEVSSHSLHSTSSPGVAAVTFCPHKPDVIATGGRDGHFVVFDTAKGKVTGSTKAHGRRITGLQYHPSEDLVVTASSDKTVRVWTAATKGKKWSEAHTIKAHRTAVTGLSMHPSGTYAATTGNDATWALLDVVSGQALAQATADDMDAKAAFTCAQFHPDGLLLCTGASDSVLRIWDVKSQTAAATFQGHTASVSSIAFSENGYYMTSCGEDNVVKMWDLRKIMDPLFFTHQTGGEVRSVDIDHSGQYLLAAGASIEVLSVSKKLASLAKWDNPHTSVVNCARWGTDAKKLVTVSDGKNVKVWA